LRSSMPSECPRSAARLPGARASRHVRCRVAV
jgi:hypothetical protein